MLELSNFVHRWAISGLTKRIKNRPQKGRCYGYVPYLNSTTSPERLKLETSDFVQWFTRCRFNIWKTNCPLSGHGYGHVTTSKFSEISNNMSETVQDRDIVTMEEK